MISKGGALGISTVGYRLIVKVSAASLILGSIIFAACKGLPELDQILTSYVARENSVSRSVYGMYDRRGSEILGYGLYSYVVFPNDLFKSRERALVQNIIGTTMIIGEASKASREVNIIYFPIMTIEEIEKSKRWKGTGNAKLRNSSLDSTVSEIIEEFYDYRIGRSVLRNFCDKSNKCPTNTSGPIIIVLPATESEFRENMPYLMIDLGTVHERAFGEFVGRLKSHVTRADWDSERNFMTLKLSLLNIILEAGDTTVPISEAFAGIIKTTK